MADGLEEVTESEMSFHHERPDSRLYRQNHTTNDTVDTKDLFTPPLGKKENNVAHLSEPCIQNKANIVVCEQLTSNSKLELYDSESYLSLKGSMAGESGVSISSCCCCRS